MKRVRKRREAYVVALHAENDVSFHATFNAYTDTNSKKLHRNSLLSESRFHHELKNHSHPERFKKAMKIELNALILRKT
jgi:hypothetical protein